MIITKADPVATLGRMDRIEQLLRAEAVADTLTESRRLKLELRKVQDDELRSFARARGLRPYNVCGSPRNWNVLSLHDGPIFCELCSRACERQEPGHQRGFAHSVGFAKAGKCRGLVAVLVHTRSPFAPVEAYARELKLSVVGPVWSWMGPEFTAALFTQRAGS